MVFAFANTFRSGIVWYCFNKSRELLEYAVQIDSLTDQRVTFAEINERSIKCALWLKSYGVQRGHVVGVATHNHLDSITPLLGCLYIGALFYPMHYQLNLGMYLFLNDFT
jgi:acyl-CoA synthetase (AMP-forming)/AMP-acid ligase II